MGLIDQRKLAKSNVEDVIRLAKYLKIKDADMARESISKRMRLEELICREVWKI